MNEIIQLLNTKLPPEITNKIIYEFNGLAHPTSVIMKEWYKKCYKIFGLGSGIRIDYGFAIFLNDTELEDFWSYSNKNIFVYPIKIGISNSDINYQSEIKYYRFKDDSDLSDLSDASDNINDDESDDSFFL